MVAATSGPPIPLNTDAWVIVFRVIFLIVYTNGLPMQKQMVMLQIGAI